MATVSDSAGDPFEQVLGSRRGALSEDPDATSVAARETVAAPISDIAAALAAAPYHDACIGTFTPVVMRDTPGEARGVQVGKFSSAAAAALVAKRHAFGRPLLPVSEHKVVLIVERTADGTNIFDHVGATLLHFEPKPSP